MKYCLLFTLILTFCSSVFADESGCDNGKRGFKEIQRCFQKYKIEVVLPAKIKKKCKTAGGYFSSFGEVICTSPPVKTSKAELIKIQNDLEKERVKHEQKVSNLDNCPSKVNRLKGPEGCSKYGKLLSSCMSSDDAIKYTCENRANYDVVFPDNMKSLCASGNKDSCVLFGETLLKCANSRSKTGKDLGQCIKDGNAFAKARDKVLKEFGPNGDTAASTLEQCLKDGVKTVKVCKEETLAYMQENYPGNNAFASNCDRTSLEFAQCGDETFAKVDNQIADLERALQKEYSPKGPSQATQPSQGTGATKEGN